MNQNEDENNKDKLTEAEKDLIIQQQIRSGGLRALSVIAVGAITRASGRYLPGV